MDLFLITLKCFQKVLPETGSIGHLFQQPDIAIESILIL